MSKKRTLDEYRQVKTYGYETVQQPMARSKYIQEEPDVRQIDFHLSLGVWVQVSPLAHNTGWVCAVYKQGKKTGNWVTEYTRTFDHPYKCYDWAEERILEIRGLL